MCSLSRENNSFLAYLKNGAAFSFTTCLQFILLSNFGLYYLYVSQTTSTFVGFINQPGL